MTFPLVLRVEVIYIFYVFTFLGFHCFMYFKKFEIKTKYLDYTHFSVGARFLKGTPTDRLMAAPSTSEAEWKKKSLQVGKKKGEKCN